MKTVILKWNPAFSSYNMHHYLSDLIDMVTEYEPDYNWSVWDWSQIHKGDRFYWVKVGMYGQTGIVASGKITSEPYKDEDWSGRGRETYYVDFLPDVVINPDALPILTCEELTKAIPDFEWDKGHSGLVLTEEQAEKVDQLWSKFLKKNEAVFYDALKKDNLVDLIYMEQA
jgi:hypothetical protein